MNKEVLDTFIKVNKEFIGNSNSLHKLGTESNKLIEAASKQILNIFGFKDKEIIYTSGRCESNNLAVFGVLEKYKGKNKNVIVQSNINSSISEPLENLNYIEKRYFTDSLENLIDKDTVMIFVNNCDKKILELARENNVLMFTDNMNNNFSYFDLISIYDESIPGIGALIKRKNLVLTNIFHGGKSTTIYRSGTPNLPFIVAFSKLLKIKYKH